MPRCLALFAALALALPGTAFAQDAAVDVRRLTLDLSLEMERVSDPQISPDGQQIVYMRRWVDKMNDSRESSLWIMNADGTKNRHLIDGSSPQWSPDGTRIVYTARSVGRRRVPSPSPSPSPSDHMSSYD